MEATEKMKNILQKNSNGNTKPRIVLICMIYCAFAISGIVEHGITVALSPYDKNVEVSKNMQKINSSRVRRYCDAPNMTAIVIYYNLNEETNVDNNNLDFEQLQEMYFQTNLSFHEEMDILLRNFFLWGNLFSPIPASRLAVNIGPKKVLGYSLLGAAASTLLVPAAWLSDAHVVLRFFQGLFCGALIPAAHSLAVNWFSSERRSSFVSLYSAKYMGYALCELLTVRIVQIFGSESIYYITGILTIIWFIPWSMTVFNTPEKHLKYSGRQKKPTITSIPLKLYEEKFPVKQFLCSRPVWMSVGAIFGAYCGQISINMAMRLYLKYVYNITDNFLTFIPFILHSLFALLCGYLVDFIQETKFVSITSSRRMFVYISHFIPAGMLFVLGFVGCNTTAPIFLYSFSIIIIGATYSGALCSPIDIAPNYAGTVVAFCSTFGVAGSLLMSYLISNVLDGQVLGSWRFTFSLTSLILLISAIFFMLRGSGTIQQWNSKIEDLETEMNIKNDRQKHSIIAPLPSKPRTKSIYAVEQKILKVLYVQEPEKFRRVRAYSTSLPNEKTETGHPNIYRPIFKKRASIS